MKKSALKVVTSAKDSYTKTKHNAIRHGVLSNIDVLPWEDATELQNLRQGFLDDFKPQGASELYLIEELATIAFRKQRLYKAENALIAKELSRIKDDYFDSPKVYKAANILARNITIKDNHSLMEALYADEEEDGENLIFYQKNIKICESIINQDAISYEEAIKTFPQDLADHWQECLTEKWVDSEDNVHTKTIESLKRFLQENVIDNFSEKKTAIESKPHIRQQAIGIAYVPDEKMQSIQRYETTMDRMFERKLSVLLKLQEIRNNKPLVLES